MYENLFIEEIHEPEIQLWQQHNKVVRKVLSDSLQLVGPTEPEGGLGWEGAFAPHILEDHLILFQPEGIHCQPR